MKSTDFLLEARKKQKAPEMEYHPGWDKLTFLKEQAHRTGKRMTNKPQLFMPRRNTHAFTNRDRRLDNLSTRWAYDDEGNIKPNYEKWEDERINEAAPIFSPAKIMVPPGNNKPHAQLWTSTAYKKKDGWFSDWAYWVSGNQSKWMSNTGYLYRVKPDLLILSLDSDYDVERVFQAFEALDRVKTPERTDYYHGANHLSPMFPWNEVMKHFDAVHHSGHSYDSPFMYGWDCESTAWFHGNTLELIGEVPIASVSDDDED